MAKKKASAKSKRVDQSGELDFEQSLEQVEKTVAQLESGQLGLSDSLEQYESGIKQLKLCHQLLDAAEQRVNVLAGFDSDGNPILESLEEGSTARKAKAKKRSPSNSDEASDVSEGSADEDLEDGSESHQSLF